MVRDGYFYGLALIIAALVLGWLTAPAWALPPLLLAAFFLWFFRDPERQIPGGEAAIVSPADGKVTDISTVSIEGANRTRISIFLNVFNVHVNRSPIAGVIRDVRYQRGKFLNAMNEVSADLNEQNIVTVDADGHTLIFKQIAGLLARRVVFNPKVGDRLERGQRIGLMKFSSRMDVILDSSARVNVKVGDHVKGGSTILAYLPAEPALVTAEAASSERSRG